MNDLPAGFVLDDPGLPPGFSLDSPEESPGFIQGGIGTAKAVGDILGGMLKIPAASVLAIGGKFADPSRSLQESWESAQGAMEETFPSLGVGEENNPGYTAPMYPFQKFGEGVNWAAKNLSGGNKDIEGAINISGNFLPIPLIKPISKGLGKIAGAVDPGLRNIKPKSFDTKLGETFERLAAPEAKSPGIETIRQHELFDQPEQFRGANPYEAVTGDWRVDENGIPVKVDLSMDVQNAQQPLQRNLWGDELPQKHPQENTMSLPEAIDSMPNLPWRTERDAGIDLLNKGGMGPEGRLDAAILEATPGFKVPRNQRGAIDFSEIVKAFPKFSLSKIKTPVYHGTTKNINDEFKTTKGFKEYSNSKAHIDKDGWIVPADRAYPGDLGTWFSSTPEGTNTFAGARTGVPGGNVHQSYINLQNPKEFATHGDFVDWFQKQAEDGSSANKVRRGLIKEGYDGISIKESLTDGGGMRSDYVAFQPEQIKSAFSGVVPKNQRGAIDLGPSNNLKQRQEKIEKIVGEKIFAKPPTAEEVLTQAIPEGRDGRGINSMEAGATLTGAKRNSALITGVSRIVQHAKNIAEDAIRTSVFPTEKGLRSLKSEEIVQLHKIMRAEMFNRRQLSMTELADLGLSEKQLLAYQAVRDMNKKALERQNAVRIASGKKPVTELEAFMTSRWKGDFRRAIHDKDGKLVWYLAAESKRGLTQQTDALMSKFPELKEGSHADHTVSSVRGTNLNAKEMYTEMLDILGRDDPAIAKIEEWMQEQVANEARGMLAQEKHFKNKSNVRGFIGDRPSNTFFGKFDPRKEALDFFQEQITYSKNAHKWSGMQEAGQELKKIFSNEELAAQQPNNMAYARDYYRNQIGLSTARAVADLENAIRQTGVSPHLLNAGVGNVKNLWITQKLAASAGFISSNIIQATNILPHLSDIMMKHGGNPLSAVTLGIPSGMLMASGHMLVAKGDRGLYKYLGVMPEAQGQFLAKAMKYAEDNSVTARSIYDETPIASSFSKTAKISEIAGKTITTPETVLRSVAYMTYVNMLKSSGKFKNDLEIFRLAEEKVNISMADYRQGEKAMLFDKLGIAGNMMNTLQTFPINFYQQWNWAAREVGRGNPLPAATMFAVQAYVAGAMGIPGFADTDKLWNFMKETAADHSPLLWNKMKGVDLKQIMLNVGDKALYGGLSEQTGISFTSRAAAPAGSEMLASPAGPYIDLARQAGDVANAGISPGGQSAAQAMLSVAPTGLQGALEVGPLKDQTSVVNPETGQRVYGSPRDLAKREEQVSRTPEEENIRAWGLRSQREVQEKDESYRINKLDRDSKTVVAALPGRVYNELRNNNTEKAKALIKLYTSLTGKEITSEQIENEALKEYTTSMQRTKMNVTTLPGMLAIKRLQQIQEQK